MAWNEPGGDQNKRRHPWQGGGGDPPDLEGVVQLWEDGLGRFGAGLPQPSGDSMFNVLRRLLGPIVVAAALSIPCLALLLTPRSAAACTR